MHPFVLCLIAAASVAGGAESVAWGPPPSLSLSFSLSPRGQKSEEHSPFVGTWVVNLAKSRRTLNHPFQSATLKFAVVGNKVTITHGGVNGGGQKEPGTVVLEADGQEHPAPEQPGIVVVTSWSGPRRLHAVSKELGATIGESRYQVSTDGKTLTATNSGTDAFGSPFYEVIVYDRKQE